MSDLGICRSCGVDPAFCEMPAFRQMWAVVPAFDEMTGVAQ
jgi:hypothetical protein